MNLLAIPNDATAVYYRSCEEDFLSEFSPVSISGERFFDRVSFLNWKDKKDEEYCNIRSFAVLRNKDKARKLMKDLANRKIEFSYPLFEDLFLSERFDIITKAKATCSGLVSAFNTHFAAELGAIVSKELQLPLVISAHDPSRLTTIVEKADSLVCISEDLKNKCVETYGIDKDRVCIIPNGVDMEVFYPRNEVYDIINPDFHSKYKILSVGRIVANKNIGTLLNAIRDVKDELGDVKHIHLGKGLEGELKKIEGEVDDLGLRGTSYFFGGKQKVELPFYYSWADVYSLPTLWEGLGRAQIEALACGTPVVTTNYAPMTEIVQDGYNGLTTNPNNPEKLASKIINVLTNENLKKRLGNNARKSVKKYDIKNIMQMHCDNYEMVLRKK